MSHLFKGLSSTNPRETLSMKRPFKVVRSLRVTIATLHCSFFRKTWAQEESFDVSGDSSQETVNNRAKSLINDGKRGEETCKSNTWPGSGRGKVSSMSSSRHSVDGLVLQGPGSFHAEFGKHPKSLAQNSARDGIAKPRQRSCTHCPVWLQEMAKADGEAIGSCSEG